MTNLGQARSIHRIAVCGQPGAGKSSLIASLSRSHRLDQSHYETVNLQFEVQPPDRLSTTSELSAVLIAIDASAPTAEPALAQTAAMLHEIARQRLAALEIPGLPVFVALTHGDQLARSNESSAVWIDRLESTKNQTYKQLVDQCRRLGTMPMGGFDLHFGAVVTGAGNSPESVAVDSFGVRELLEQLVKAVLAYQNRTSAVDYRIRWLSALTSGLLAALVALAALLALRPEPSELAFRVNNLRAAFTNRPNWLHEPLRAKRQLLSQIRSDPDFDDLDAIDRSFVVDVSRELEDYIDYRQRLAMVNMAAPHTDEELDSLERSLSVGSLAPPAAYVADWLHTSASDYRALLIKDLGALRQAISAARAWYLDAAARVNQAFERAPADPSNARDWHAWLETTAAALGPQFPFPPARALPGAVTVTYLQVIQSVPVQPARREWMRTRDRLARLRDLIIALGLAEFQDGGLPAPLRIPASFRAEEASARLDQLRRFNPDLEKPNTIAIPESMTSAIRTAADRDYANLIAAGQFVIRRHFRLQNPANNPGWQAWQSLRLYLAHPTDLADWRVLCRIINSLRGPRAADPIDSLREFLNHDSFDLDPHQLTLAIPESAGVAIAAQLTIRLVNPAGQSEWAFSHIAPASAGLAKQGASEFRLDRGGPKTYQPGDSIIASMPVSRADHEGQWLLTWDQPRTAVCQFDALAQPPRLRPANRPDAGGKEIAGVRITLLPPGSWPALPDLFPSTINSSN